MDRLFVFSERKVRQTSTEFRRYLYDQINWDNRLIAIKGAKGVGKTTLMLQRMKLAFADQSNIAVYVSLDHIWFMEHSLLDFIEFFYTHGGTHVFLDEVHKYPNWAREIKNIYDFYPDMHIVVSGSSMLKIETEMSADLSRRHRGYVLKGLSFREYLQMEGVIDLPACSFDNLLQDHVKIASEITQKIKPLPYFENYLKAGYYPFYKEEGDGFEERLQSVINNVVEVEIPTIGNIEYESVYKIKRMMKVFSRLSPYVLNATALAGDLGITRNTLLKLLNLMEKSALIRQLFANADGMGLVSKPEKILFENTNIAYAYSDDANIGTVRETYLASQLQGSHTLSMPQQGDLLVDDKYLFEVGGRKKGYKQIKDIDSSYIVSDTIEQGVFNKIPLWVFGMLY